MKMAMCPTCRVAHEAVNRRALDGATAERIYRITHCRLCKTPSETFLPLPDEPDLADDELGYPMAVVPWVAEDATPPAHWRAPSSGSGASARASKRRAK